jgi:hypothetical protein
MIGGEKPPNASTSKIINIDKWLMVVSGVKDSSQFSAAFHRTPWL